VSFSSVTILATTLLDRGRKLADLPADAAAEEVDPDLELVRRWQGGDLEAFSDLVKRHELRVFRLLLRMLGSREEAEDVAQETFLNLHRHGHRFRSESRFSTFVYRVAVNAALNRRRSLGRKRARMEALAERQAAGDHLPETPRGPEDATGGGEIQVRVQQAITKLPANLRAPLVLYDIEGQPYSEIAKSLGVAEGTVKSRIHRARAALRGLLGDLAPGRNQDSVATCGEAER
jgi:RNA polymerase sigma-70 factor (ECF subfamily)